MGIPIILASRQDYALPAWVSSYARVFSTPIPGPPPRLATVAYMWELHGWSLSLAVLSLVIAVGARVRPPRAPRSGAGLVVATLSTASFVLWAVEALWRQYELWGSLGTSHGNGWGPADWLLSPVVALPSVLALCVVRIVSCSLLEGGWRTASIAHPVSRCVVASSVIIGLGSWLLFAMVNLADLSRAMESMEQQPESTSHGAARAVGRQPTFLLDMHASSNRGFAIE